MKCKCGEEIWYIAKHAAWVDDHYFSMECPFAKEPRALRIQHAASCIGIRSARGKEHEPVDALAALIITEGQ